MIPTSVHFESDPAIRHFRTGVSLHGHTLHSHETLGWRSACPRCSSRSKKGGSVYRAANGTELDLTRAWWTPPCAPLDAWKLETKHIHDLLNMNALISLTDHDNIDAPANLRILETCRGTPISVEWTAPFENTFFHLSVHNLAADRAPEIMRELEEFTDHPDQTRLPDLLNSLAANPATLIVFNHPYWDERGIGEDAHRDATRRFATTHLAHFHAFELNGLRPWKENRAVFDLSSMFHLPLISGGDRHALEANTILNLTRVATFDEFVYEIRKGKSHVLITEQYMEPFALRILQNIEEILSDQPNHALSWRRWNDRTFYRYDDGSIRPPGQSWVSAARGHHFRSRIATAPPPSSSTGVPVRAGPPQRGHFVIPTGKAPRIAFFTDSFHEVNGVALTSREFASRHYGRMREKLIAFRPDVVHGTGPSHPGLLGLILAHQMRAPIAASWHTNLHEIRISPSGKTDGLASRGTASPDCKTHRMGDARYYLAVL